MTWILRVGEPLPIDLAERYARAWVEYQRHGAETMTVRINPRKEEIPAEVPTIDYA